MPALPAGPRSAKDLADALTKALPATYITKLSDEAQLAAFEEANPNLARVLLYSVKDRSRSDELCMQSTGLAAAWHIRLCIRLTCQDQASATYHTHALQPDGSSHEAGSLCARSASEQSLLCPDQSSLFCSKYAGAAYVTTLQCTALHDELICCSTLFKSLSARFRGRLAFAQISKQSSSLAEAISPEQLPLLVVKQPGQDAEHKYEGEC